LLDGGGTGSSNSDNGATAAERDSVVIVQVE